MSTSLCPPTGLAVGLTRGRRAASSWNARQPGVTAAVRPPIRPSEPDVCGSALDPPIRAHSSESSYSLMEFMREFPDDATCLEWLWRDRYSEDGEHAFCPKCDRERKFHKVRERPAWDCDSCGHHLHPLAGTIFHKSSTSLHLWFFAIHLMTSTRCGVSAKHLERELGVTYKTASRMANLIRNKLMTPDQRLLAGYVEVDETSVDGKPRRGYLPKGTEAERRSAAMKLKERSRATVFAAVERGGRIK